jgi:CBS domain-containing protein
MTTDVSCCTADTPIAEVAKLMVQHDCGEIPVCDEARRPIGVVTDRDIVTRIIARDHDPRARAARDCMSEPVVTANPDMPVEQAANLMAERRVRRIPVVDEHGATVGMLAQADLARHASKQRTAEVVEEISQPATAHAEAAV